MTRDRGSTTVAMIGVIASLLVLTLAVSGLAALYAARARAHTAADAAALAAAVATYPAAAEGPPASTARHIAAANGALLSACECSVNTGLSVRTVLVSVTVDAKVPVFGSVAVHGSARAEFDTLRWLGIDVDE